MKTIVLLLAMISVSFCQLTVGVVEYFPHVIVNNDTIDGFDPDILNYIAEDLELEIEYVPYPNLQSLIESDCDIKTTGITITHNREIHSDFSYPYFTSNLAVLEKKDNGLILIIQTYIEHTWLGVLGFISFVLLMALLMWRAEYGYISFDDRFKRGMFESIYYTNTTFTTVGYGDKTPVTNLGMIIAQFMMYLGPYFIAPLMVAQMAYIGVIISNDHISEKPIVDIIHNDISTVVNTSSEIILRRYTSNLTTGMDLADCINKLDNEEIDMVVYDNTSLFRFNDEYRVYNLDIQQNHGFIINDDELRNKINISLLQLMESGDYDRIKKKWFQN